MQKERMFKVVVIYTLFMGLSIFQSVKGQNIQHDRIDELIQQASELDFEENDKKYSLYQEVRKQSQAADYKKAEAEALYWIGRIDFLQDRRESAFKRFNESLKLSLAINDKGLIVKNYYGLAVCSTYNNRYYQSAQLYLKGLEYAKESNDSANMMNIYQGLAYQYKRLENPQKNLYYLKQSLSMAEALRDTLSIISLKTTILEDAPNPEQEIDIVDLKSMVSEVEDDLSAIAFYEVYSQFLLNKKEYESAERAAQKSLRLARKVNHDRSIMLALIKLGRINQAQKNWVAAESYLSQSLAIAKSAEFYVNQMEISKELSEVYAQTGRYQDAFEASSNYSWLKDSLTTVEKLVAVSNITEKYENFQKEREITRQRLKIEEQNNTILRSQKRTTYIVLFTSIFIFLLTIALILYRNKHQLKIKEIARIKSEHKLSRLNSIMIGEEKERRKIARNLHDGINGDLVAFKLKLSTYLEKYGGLPFDKRNEVIKDVDLAIEAIRESSHDLAPPALMQNRLEDALRDYCQNHSFNNPNLDIIFQCMGEPFDFYMLKKISMFRIVQELITNIIKHSGASQAIVQLNYMEGEIYLVVEDNGRGFDVEKAKNGIGLNNIKTRLKMLQAEYDIQSDERGTEFSMNVKFEDPKEILENQEEPELVF